LLFYILVFVFFCGLPRTSLFADYLTGRVEPPLDDPPPLLLLLPLELLLDDELPLDELLPLVVGLETFVEPLEVEPLEVEPPEPDLLNSLLERVGGVVTGW
jgi:hypothetical protein